MQKTHDLILIVEGAGLYNRADQNLNQAASDCVNHDADQDAGIRIGKQIRKKCKPDESGGG